MARPSDPANRLWEEPMDRPRPPPKPRKSFAGLKVGDRLVRLIQSDLHQEEFLVESCDSEGVSVKRVNTDERCRLDASWKTLFQKLRKSPKKGQK